MLNSSAPQGWFSGTPSVIDYGSAVAENAHVLLSGALDSVLADETTKLRDQARSLPNWGSKADYLSSTYDAAGQEIVFQAEGPHDEITQIKDVEYGVTNRVSASGFLRKNAAATIDIELAVNRYIREVLG